MAENTPQRQRVLKRTGHVSPLSPENQVKQAKYAKLTKTLHTSRPLLREKFGMKFDALLVPKFTPIQLDILEHELEHPTEEFMKLINDLKQSFNKPDNNRTESNRIIYNAASKKLKEYVLSKQEIAPRANAIPRANAANATRANAANAGGSRKTRKTKSRKLKTRKH